MDTVKTIEEIQNFIATGELSSALAKLRALLAESPKLNEVLVLTRRYKSLVRRINSGTIEFDAAEAHNNRIAESILALIDGNNKQEDADTSDFESRNSILVSGSTNFLINSTINTGRDVRIGDHCGHGDLVDRVKSFKELFWKGIFSRLPSLRKESRQSS